MATIFIISIGILGAYAVSSRIIAYINLSLSQLTASYLAQEGIELVRNIRDTNWLERSSWDDGLGNGEWEIAYNENALSSFTGRKINLYDGTQTKFIRKITINSAASPQGYPILKISVLVQWKDKGKDYSVTAQENLYNWHIGT